MADYRQSCSNPACSYTGFSGHSPGCPVPFEQQELARERASQKDAEDLKWNAFFGQMSEEKLFQYIDNAEKKIAELMKHEERKRRALVYIRHNRLTQKYLDRRRNG